MNRLTTEKRAQIIGALVEGNSIRATCRMTGAAKNTVTKLLCDLGQACVAYQDEHLRDLACTTLQCDEIWAFCHAKAKNVPEQYKGTFGYGDIWTFTAICADTKLVPTFLVGERNAKDAETFLRDLDKRLTSRVQLTTDGHSMYLTSVAKVWSNEIDYAMLHKHYGQDENTNERRYSPAICLGTEKRPIWGNPDPAKISTSYVERQNLTMRMGMRRFTRLTNAFSKKAENLVWAVSLHFMHYNFARPHKSLVNPYPRTPAMAAGVSDHVWSLREIATLLD